MARFDSFDNLSYYFHNKDICKVVYMIHSVISSVLFNIYAILLRFTSNSCKAKNSRGYSALVRNW